MLVKVKIIILFSWGGGIFFEKTNEPIFIRSDQLIKCGVKIIILVRERTKVGTRLENKINILPVLPYGEAFIPMFWVFLHMVAYISMYWILFFLMGSPLSPCIGSYFSLWGALYLHVLDLISPYGEAFISMYGVIFLFVEIMGWRPLSPCFVDGRQCRCIFDNLKGNAAYF